MSDGIGLRGKVHLSVGAWNSIRNMPVYWDSDRKYDKAHPHDTVVIADILSESGDSIEPTKLKEGALQIDCWGRLPERYFSLLLDALALAKDRKGIDILDLVYMDSSVTSVVYVWDGGWYEQGAVYPPLSDESRKIGTIKRSEHPPLKELLKKRSKTCRTKR